MRRNAKPDPAGGFGGFRQPQSQWEVRRVAMLWIYGIAINCIGFAMMGIDKHRAIRGAWRISEASLFLAALLGGALGATLGMRVFHHKTRHWYFRYGMPAIFLLQLSAACLFRLLDSPSF